MRDRLWTKDFTIDVCINFLLYVIMYQLMLWSTQFAIHTWDATVSEAGLASGIFIIGALSSRIITGHVIDALGRKKALLVGTGIYMAGLLLYFPVHSLTAFLVIRCLHGAAYGISATAASTIVGAIVPPKRRGEGIGYYALGNTLASAAGPFLGMTLCSGGNYYLNVYVCIGLAVLTFALAAAIHSPEHVCTAADRAALKSLRWDSFISVQALPISIISFFCGIGYSTVLSFIGAYTNSLNLAIAGSIFFCTYSVTSFFSRPIIGRFLDHHGGDAVMYPTLAILALCMAAVGLAESNALFAIGGVLLGLSYSTVTSSGQALAIHGVPEDHIGLATSTFFIFVDLGVGVGPYMLGSLVPAYGFSSVYFGAAVIALAAIPLYYALIGRTGVFSYKQMERIRSKER
ncbi:MFS transporter [Megasphaera sp. ASD88]|uniref:MFS transporter n=1 Tax=unclassified Megasphaera TaxID=2626256 RepID=UPI000B3BC916|nr:MULTISPECIES: MFS transporter [unclassified Megasphaera]OUO45029.1 hypothetical protein B5F80_09765 [Megasphaera sp. An286]PAV39009.1 MFS transporter [Megasphaera sp. ASD88]